MTDSKFLVEYRDANGLLLPQYGGCWHDTNEGKASVPMEGSTHRLVICSRCRRHAFNPDLATPQGF